MWGGIKADCVNFPSKGIKYKYMNQVQHKIDISHKTIFFITGFFLLLWALYQIREVIILLFVAIIFMSALSPVVSYLENLKFPRTISVAIVYVMIITIIGSIISFVVTALVDETATLAQNIPTYAQRLLPDGVLDVSVLNNQITGISSNAFSFTFTIFNNLLAIISILVLTFYLILERAKVDKLVGQMFVGHELRASRIMIRIEEKLGSWLRGQIVLSFIIGGLVYIALAIPGVPFALPLAIIAGILEVVPVIGPIISAIPAILIAFTSSPILAAYVAIAFFVIQQLENSLIVPQVMNKAVGLNPLIVILAVAIGGKLLGISGALLAVPITVVIQILIEDVLKDEDLLKE